MPYLTRQLFIRAVVGGVGALLAASSVYAATKAFRIGLLRSGEPSRYDNLLQLLGAPLRDLATVTFVERWVAFEPDSALGLATELVALGVDVIVVEGSSADVRSAMRASKTVPIVFLDVGDPVQSGIVSSLGRPGGNVTGVSSMAPELEAKHLEFLKQAIPNLRQVGYIGNSANRDLDNSITAVKGAGDKLGVECTFFDVRSKGQLAGTLRSMAASKVGAFIQQDDPMLVEIATQAAVFALENKIAFAAPLMRYGVLLCLRLDFDERIGQFTSILSKILTGAKPMDIPVEQPGRFVLSLSQRTADVIGVRFPKSLLLRADVVIQ